MLGTKDGLSIQKGFFTLLPFTYFYSTLHLFLRVFLLVLVLPKAV